MATNTITVGVPVYRGEQFLEETLHSIQAQTHRAIEVIISFDGPEPETEKLCAPFLKDSRFRSIVQPARRGWVGNINWLMAQIATPYWCYQQQDDLIDPRYLEVLLDYAQRTPEAAVVYCDMVAFGQMSWKCAQPSVTGSPAARQLALLYEHYPAVAFRGLTRSEALRHAGGIPTNELDNCSVETTWMSAVARWGELQRVPGELYHKRFHDDNTSVKYARWPAEKRARAWIVHCADMLEQAVLVEATTQERRLLWLAAVARLVSARTAFSHFSVATLAAGERVALLNGFLNYIQTTRRLDIPGWLEADWAEIQFWTGGFYWLPASA